MSGTQNGVRILLGPVAQELIAGTDTNRPTALDQAILELKEASEAAVTQHRDPSARDAPH